MKYFISIFVIFAVFTSTGSAYAEKRVALIIGNSTYEHAKPLINPSKDAALMANTLRKLNFQVIEARNVSLKKMRRAISNYTRELRSSGPDTVGFIYYAGHGVQIDGLNYLVPVDARIKHEADIAIEALSVNDILGSISKVGNRINLVFFDACRDNPYRSLFRSSRQGLASINAPEGYFIAYASAPGQVASDGEGTNSPFTSSLAKHISTPGLTIERILKRVGRDVLKETNGEQRPWRSTDLNYDFYPAGENTALKVPQVVVKQRDVCTDARKVFSEIKGQTACGVWKTYIEDFKSCTHWANIARSLMREHQCGVKRNPTPDRQEQAKDKPEQVPSKEVDIASELQRELKRVGCYHNAIDGDWGRGSRSALIRFNTSTRSRLTSFRATQEALAAVRKHRVKVCIPKRKRPEIKRQKVQKPFRKPKAPTRVKRGGRPGATAYSYKFWGKGNISGIATRRTPYGRLVCTRASTRFDGPPRQCHWE